MIEFRAVQDVPDRYQILWQLMRERSTDAALNISHRTMPTWEAHCRFVDTHPYYRWWLVKSGPAWLGSLSITSRNEIGLVLVEAQRDKGYGTKILRALLARERPLPAKPSERPSCFVANINPANHRSIRLFEKIGFRHVQNTYLFDDGA